VTRDIIINIIIIIIIIIIIMVVVVIYFYQMSLDRENNIAKQKLIGSTDK
jgi:flagellar basal body-associated protein FliL